MNNDDEKVDPGIIRGCGYTTFFCFILFLLCIPGMLTYKMFENSHRKNIINELCNKANGKYDFCKLDNTTYHYIENVEEGN